MSSKVPLAISHYDLNHFLKKENKSVEDLTKQELNTVLHFLGMEVGSFEEEEVLHRPMHSPNNESWYGKRFIGNERQDHAWLFSKKSSIDNIIASNDDLDHVQDLMNMSRQSNNTGYIAEQIERFKPENPEVNSI